MSKREIIVYRILICSLVLFFILSLFITYNNSHSREITNTNTNTINIDTTDKREGQLNINLCSREALIALPGVGNVLADRIIEGRPYIDVYALDRVDGIGQETIELLKGKVVF
ncbi:helix-hairpin-helix domain-containing protein [Paenibacillus sp. FSL R7-0204]|uniref:ComEA family DNA-binding protein n=1 Tax=Paenibacillus sp. FSL R7-0204 TaxID=2921675 RepID=UPI0030FCFB91